MSKLEKPAPLFRAEDFAATCDEPMRAGTVRGEAFADIANARIAPLVAALEECLSLSEARVKRLDWLISVDAVLVAFNAVKKGAGNE